MHMHKTQVQQATVRRLTRLLQHTSGLTLGEELRLILLALSARLTAFLKVSTCNMPQLLKSCHLLDLVWWSETADPHFVLCADAGAAATAIRYARQA